MVRQTGIYERLGETNYFIPDPLPPQNPPFEMDNELNSLYGMAMHRLGQLNEMAQRVPDKNRFIKAYVIKEALLSSAIEGIHTTLIDVFTQPLGESKPNKETQLVLNYTHALEQALSMMQEMPIASRLILAAHETLMHLGYGDTASPGQYRKQSVRVGNLIPPMAPKIPDLMASLESFINTDDSLPPLIKAGLAHVQFETIHPFLDGNGRIGRLLIVLMLIDSGFLSAPIVYPSYYFKKHHREYYERLDSVRTHGDFEGWIKYYLKGIEASSFDAYQRAKDIELLEKNIRDTLEKDDLSDSMKNSLGEVVVIFFQSPVISIKELSTRLNKSYNTAHSIIDYFVAKGLLSEITQQQRNKLYTFQPYLALLEKEYI
jgi:cell filamentation protein, protein adenylyltransferase